MGILLWIVLGAISGWIASMFMYSQQGTMSDILLGIIGAVVGGLAVSIFGQTDVAGFNIYGIVVSVIGAALAIWAGRTYLRTQRI